MFLNELSEKEKMAFLSLSIHVANANDVVEEEENVVIDEYCKEMSITNFSEEDVITLDDVVSIFAESSQHIKKIVLLETIGLAYADGVYDSKEKEFVENFAINIGLSQEDVTKFVDVFLKYMEVLREMTSLVE